jgi:cell division transport system permease protein
MRSFFFLIGEAFINLRRHGLMTVAAVTTIAVTLCLLGAFALTFYQMHVATNRAAGEFEMHVFCREQVKKDQIPGIEQRLKEIPGVASVRYLSKEQAFAEYTKGLPIDTQGIPNRFNETFVVKLSDPKRAAEVASTVRSWHGEVQEVSLPEAEMGGVLKIMDFLRMLGVVGGALLLFGALLVVSNTIRISVFTRRREIKIMQIVGATPWFIRLPLFFEGLIHGVIGGLVASLALVLIDRSTHSLISDVIPMLSRYFTRVDMAYFALVIVAAGALIGAGGSLLSIRRYLRIA